MYIFIKVFFLEYAGGLHIIALGEGLGQNSQTQCTCTSTHTHTPLAHDHWAILLHLRQRQICYNQLDQFPTTEPGA
jgi:hypothetical protein